MMVYYPQMNTSGASKVLPIILTAITLATAVFFYKQREVLRQKTQELLNRSTKQTVVKPTEFAPTPSASPTPTPISQTNEVYPGTVVRRDSSQVKLAQATTTVCTPVYGMANTCAESAESVDEHAVVDTALDTTIFYNLAGLSYFAGLAAFIKAKKRS